MNRYAYSPREVRQLRRRLWWERWRTLSWFDVKRARLWQGVIIGLCIFLATFGGICVYLAGGVR